MDPVQAFLQANALQTPLFPPASRYHGSPAATFTLPDGTMIAYLRRRFVPPPERFALLQRAPRRGAATASTTSRPGTSAIRSSTGASATRTARCGPTS